MGKKNKKKAKKVSPKKEKYAKFHKEKPGTLDVSMPDLGEDGVVLRQENDKMIDRFMRTPRNPPPKEIVARKALSKR